MGSKPRIPQKSAADLKREKMQDKLLKVQLANAKKPIEIPQVQMPEPVKPAAPPPSQNSADVVDANRAAKAYAAKRQGYGRTLFAGALGGQPSPLG